MLSFTRLNFLQIASYRCAPLTSKFLDRKGLIGFFFLISYRKNLWLSSYLVLTNNMIFLFYSLINVNLSFSLMGALKELLRYHDQFLFQSLLLLHEHDPHAINGQRRRKILIPNEHKLTNYVGLRSLQH